MDSYTTIFGELVTFKTVPMTASNYKFIVEKRVNGQLRSSYPVKSNGQARLLISKAVA